MLETIGMVSASAGRGRRSTVARVFDVLDFLALHPEPLGVTDVARGIACPKATAHRLLKAIEQKAGVVFDGAGYALGPKLIYLGEQVRSRLRLVHASRPIMAALAATQGETVSLGILYQDRILIVENTKPGKASILTAQLGPVAELHCSSLGKALLAHLPRERLEAVLQRVRFTGHTPKTITDVRRFQRELAEVRRRGVAHDREETEVGVACIGAAIRDRHGALIAAVSLSGPAFRLRGKRRVDAERAVLSAARRIESLVGAFRN